MYIQAWDQLCCPRAIGKLGFRKFLDINQGFIANLGWQVISSHNHIWVQLIKARYLRGHQLLSLEKCPTNASWVMQGIWSCKSIIEHNAYYKIGGDSELNIYLDPWIPSLVGFGPPCPSDWSYDVSKGTNFMLQSSWSCVELIPS